ncbi:MAG: hypothetical protein AAGI30_00335 [Planctomycetota bacterium]
MKQFIPACAVVCLVLAQPAIADFSLTNTVDPTGNPNGDPATNAPGAFDVAQAFDALLVDATVVDFEAASNGLFTSATAADLGVGSSDLVGITETAGSNGDELAIVQQAGQNTTIGGINSFQITENGAGEPPTGALFTFSAPQRAFGFYYASFNNAAGLIEVIFGDEVIELVEDTDSSYTGFFGLTVSEDMAFTEIEIRLAPENGSNNDTNMFDDIRFAADVIPSPAAVTLLGLAGLARVRRRR